MNRRTAVKRLSLAVGGVALSLVGIEYYRLHKRPSFELLGKSEALLGHLADTIIPPTADSPGALAAGTGAFIVRMVKDCTDRTSQNNFIEGLDGLMSFTKRRYGKSFEECGPVERRAILQHYAGEERTGGGKVAKAKRQIFGDPFFTTLKKYTVMGYCSSKLGATQGLRYDYIPGKYVGSVVLQPGEKAWATQ